MPREMTEIEDVTVLRETALAILVRVPMAKGPPRDEWIPKSHISDDSEVWKDGQSGTIMVTEWIATQKGLV
jgi:hypothetical protein